MIKCTFVCSKTADSEINFRSFEISGHAGYKKKGEDIVCASVSSVTQHTARALSKDGALINIEDGYLKVWNIESDMISQRFVKELYETLKDLSEQYPRYIKVEVIYDAY